jgi:hypothetical protein
MLSASHGGVYLCIDTYTNNHRLLELEESLEIQAKGLPFGKYSKLFKSLHEI